MKTAIASEAMAVGVLSVCASAAFCRRGGGPGQAGARGPEAVAPKAEATARAAAALAAAGKPGARRRMRPSASDEAPAAGRGCPGSRDASSS